jgi:hypothetical protein
MIVVQQLEEPPLVRRALLVADVVERDAVAVGEGFERVVVTDRDRHLGVQLAVGPRGDARDESLAVSADHSDLGEFARHAATSGCSKPNIRSLWRRGLTSSPR